MPVVIESKEPAPIFLPKSKELALLVRQQGPSRFAPRGPASHDLAWHIDYEALSLI